MFADYATSIHADNVTAGWFTDITTGESIVATRNRPEMMMLAITELSEAAEGIGSQDDKLPHLPAFDVEVADFQIRIFDLIGCEVSCGTQMPAFGRDPNHFLDLMERSDPEGQLMYVVNLVSRAMEHYRKSRTLDYVTTLAEALLASVALCDLHNIDWQDMIRQKRAFNASRADHRIENRRADGGKKC